ncbi:actophorin-like [Ruditapes philippinarum]|uniref:actophorin-like n=1 Tax=Ruditapes philippinarum TaxID=129788 RepID=UPI00295A8422|nr:actophorin-like [Ruditapes philippinarum]
MASGVLANSECKKAFEKLKMRSETSQDGDGEEIGRFVIMKLNGNNSEIIVEYKSKPDETFDDFRALMKEAAEAGEGRYAFYDVLKPDQDEKAHVGEKGDLAMIVWCSDDKCAIKQRMLYSSSKDALKKACTGFKKEFQVNDLADLTLDELQSKFKK